MYNKKPNDVNKVYCNTLVCDAFEKYIYNQNRDSKLGVFILDDHHFQSTYSLTSRFNNLVIQLAQYDGWTFKKMYNNLQWITSDDENTIELHYSDYGDLIPKIGKVHLDHADFCSGWVKNKHIIEHRLHNTYYANSAILRLTVSYRGCKMSGEDHVQMVMTDLYDMVVSTNYTIKPLTISQLDIDYISHDFTEAERDCICFSYGTMQTYIIHIHSIHTK